MRKRYTIIIAALCFCIQVANAAKPRELERKMQRASDLYSQGNYPEALDAYLELYKSDTSNYMLCYHTGACYLKSGNQNKKALYFLERAVNIYSASKLQEVKLPKQVYKYLGDAYHMNLDIENAVENYLIYKSLIVADSSQKEVLKEIDRRLKICSNARELISDPVKLQISNMGIGVNSGFADYAPKLSADQCTMIFTSCRPEKDGSTVDENEKFLEDIYIATRKDQESPWKKAATLPWELNTPENEAVVGISSDGKEMLIYKDDKGDGNIYLSKFANNRWSEPEKLNANINSKYWEPCAFITDDGKAIYFVSDRPGGYGGTDIYMSEKIGNDWGPAVNLGPSINTVYDEYSPFLHKNGNLYFSSKGHNSMGGYDVFMSGRRLNNEKIWLAPTNLGFPVNGPGDDAFFILSPDQKTAYYTSYRDGGYGEKDNYMIRFPEPIDLPPVSLREETAGTQQADQNFVISVIDPESGEIAGVYHPQTKTGKFQIILSPGNQKITVQNGNFECKNELVQKESESLLLSNDIYFGFDECSLNLRAKSELDRIADFLKNNPNVKIKISGYADSRGKTDYNEKLSLSRASSVMNYLMGKGIKGERLHANACGECAPDNNSEFKARRAELRVLALK